MFFKYKLIFTVLLFILNANIIFAESTIKNQVLKIDKVITLNDAINIALSNNPGLLMKKNEVKKARLEVKEIAAMRLPSISSTYYWSIGNSSNILTTPEGVSPQSSMLVPSKTFNDLNLTMMLPIYTGGTLSAKERQAKFMEMSEKDMLKEKENETVFQTTELYYRALFTDEYLKVIDDWMELVSAQLNRTKSLFEAGKVPKADLLRDKAELANIKQSKTEALNNKDIAMLDLKTIMGISTDSKLILQSLFNDNISNVSYDEVVHLAFENRPEYKAALKKVDSYKESIRAAKGRFLPQISLMGMYDIFQSSTMMGENGYTIGVVGSIPVYDGGVRKYILGMAETEHEKSISEAKYISIRIENEIKQAVLQLNAAAQNILTAKSALESTGEYARITELRYDAGRAIKIEVYDALLNEVRAKTNYLRALFDLNVANARLQYAIGNR